MSTFDPALDALGRARLVAGVHATPHDLLGVHPAQHAGEAQAIKQWVGEKEAWLKTDIKITSVHDARVALESVDVFNKDKKEMLPVTPLGRYLKVLLSSSEFLFVD